MDHACGLQGRVLSVERRAGRGRIGKQKETRIMKRYGK
jgi:hypothetical protein